MAQTINFTGQLVVVTCWCGIAHAIPSDLNRWASQSDRNTVYCPLGHEWVVRDSVENKLKRERDRSSYLQSRVDQEQARADHEASRAAGYKGHLTRVKKRVGNGVCPCCNRSFVNLARHMAGQHPDYTDEEPAK